MSTPVVLGIIPARWSSSRFPGKPLAPLAGRPLIEHVWRRARRSALLQRLVIATDDVRIADAARRFGGEAVMTSPGHLSGTDRAAEVARDVACDIVVNVQGDEPLIEPGAIDAAIRPLLEEPALDAVTLAAPITTADDFASPHVVKVVRRLDGAALYFSRAPIPAGRADGVTTAAGAPEAPAGREPPGAAAALRHVGLYAWRRAFLLELAGWPPSPLELCERLEQLRVIEHGRSLRVVRIGAASPGVDTPEDLLRVAAMLRDGA